MMDVLCSLLIPIAAWLEVAVWRSRSVDAQGRLRPSLRERAIAERFYRDRRQHELRRIKP